MPDVDGLKEAKNYGVGIPQKSECFFLKGSGSLDWGMKNRLARIFDPTSGRTAMLAIDHGYFQGPTTGLERVDLNILPLVPYADTLMLTRGILRSIVPASTPKSIVLRVSGGTSILKESVERTTGGGYRGRRPFECAAPWPFRSSLAGSTSVNRSST